MVSDTPSRSSPFDGTAGRLISVSRDGKTFTYGYDPNGNVRSRNWPDGTTVTSIFTAANQLATLSVAGGQLGSAAQYGFEYDPSGRLSKTTYPTADHLVTDRVYDRAGRLSDLNSRNDSGTMARYQLTRDPVGNPTGIITTTRGTTSQHVAYTYDLFDRLTAACVGADCGATATGKIAYSYDGVGNRLSQALSGSAGNSQTTYTYDSASQLTGSTITTPTGTTSVTYAYDRQGILVQAGSDTFTYNLDHTIASATVGGSATEYAYDGQGIQTSATTVGTAQSRTWQTDVNQVLPQLATETVTGGGTTTSRGFLSTPDLIPLGLLTSGQTDSYALDTVDGVANVVNPAGSTLAAYDYEPFGSPRSDGTAAGIVNGVTNPIQFAGGYQDMTLGARYSTLARVYDPAAGRYQSVDPVTQAFNEPAISPYVYVADRPTVSRDPSGAIPLCSDVNLYSATCESVRVQLRPTQPVIGRPAPTIWAPPKADPWREVKMWASGPGASAGQSVYS